MLKGPMTVDFIGYSLSLWLRTCLEVTKQAGKRCLIAIMLFPASEVSDIPLVTNLGCPSQRTSKYCLVQPNWKEYRSLLLSFFSQSQLHFMFYPPTSDSIL